ncbi:tail assembly protein [Escherichia coli]|uniref:tail assembly protein n=1 Tax=Escherichia coli TaxID=562 RepID=UPI001BB11103
MNTAAEAIRALSLQVPGFRRQMNEGWYQIRIAVMTRHRRRCTPVFTNSWVRERIHIVPRLAGAGKGGLQIVLGAAAIVGSFFTAGINGVMGFSPGSRWFFCHHDAVFTWSQHDSGRCGPDAGPEGKTPDYRATDNGRQNTYFSSLDNMIAQGNPMPVPYGEMLVGSRRISRTSAP